MHISCESKCKFDERNCNSDQWWNNDKYRCECKKYPICKIDYIWNASTCICEYEKYLVSIIDDSVITFDEIIEETFPTNLSEKKATRKTQNSYILLSFLLITIALLIAVSIYCYLIEYRVKQKHLLPFHFLNNSLKI